MDRGLFGFVDGSEPELPEETDANIVRTYNQRKQRALSTICMAIERPQKMLVDTVKTAKEAWEKLVNIYEPKTRARIAALRKHFYSLKMDPEEEMSVYLSRVQKAATDLLNAGKKLNGDEVAYQMLAGVPDEFNVTATIIPVVRPGIYARSCFRGFGGRGDANTPFCSVFCK